MRDTDLTKLRRKRSRIHFQLAKLEPLVAAYHAKLVEVEAARSWRSIRSYGFRHVGISPTHTLPAMSCRASPSRSCVKPTNHCRRG